MVEAMSLPAEYQTCRVTGHWIGLNGLDASGSVTFQARANRIVAPESKTIILPSPVRADLVDGRIAIDLPATDDPDISPVGFTYQVTERFDKQGGLVYFIEAPADGELDLSGVVETHPSSGVTVTRGPQGPPGSIQSTREPVGSSAELPSSGVAGDTIITLDTGHAWQWIGSAWADVGPIQGPPAADAGLLSERPAASSLGNGFSFFAADDLGGTTSVVRDGVWVRQSLAAAATTVAGHGTHVGGSVQASLEALDDAVSAQGFMDRCRVSDRFVKHFPMLGSHPDGDQMADGTLSLEDTPTTGAAASTEGNALRLSVSEPGTQPDFGDARFEHGRLTAFTVGGVIRLPAAGANNQCETYVGLANPLSSYQLVFRTNTASPSTLDVMVGASGILHDPITTLAGGSRIEVQFTYLGENLWGADLNGDRIDETGSLLFNQGFFAAGISKLNGSEPRSMEISRFYGVEQ